MRTDQPRALVIRTAGTNCDAELVRALQIAGAHVELTHVHQLIASPAMLDACSIIGFPGGFSYGDDVASGRVLAAKLREQLWPALREARDRGALMIGVCNGFQVLTQLGLLPGWTEQSQESPPRPVTALVDNEQGRFIDRWLRVRFESDSVCVWTRGVADQLDAAEERLRDAALQLPIAHGEGRFVADCDATLDALEARRQVALRYVDNANGSTRAIAGICDPSGRIFGLMPHPERFLSWRHHPCWTRLGSDVTTSETIGLRIFRNAVEAARTCEKNS